MLGMPAIDLSQIMWNLNQNCQLEERITHFVDSSLNKLSSFKLISYQVIRPIDFLNSIDISEKYSQNASMVKLFYLTDYWLLPTKP